jgi:hypothetical protein
MDEWYGAVKSAQRKRERRRFHVAVRRRQNERGALRRRAQVAGLKLTFSSLFWEQLSSLSWQQPWHISFQA